jgi:DNA polymerase
MTARLADIAEQAAGCTACDLYRDATQTVFGEGPAPASMMLVGEQPGDQEDKAGHPFVGPAGRVLDQAMKEAGLVRSDVYVTNAVKHFKWTARGKRRIHQRPDAGEVEACSRWLTHEVELVQPEIVVALGVTAARALLASRDSITKLRGRVHVSTFGVRTVVTVHPASVVRLRGEDRTAQLALLVEDLRLAADVA